MNVSEKRIAANRANAQKSTGPKTPQGKSNSSHNATTHGMLASIAVLRNENPESFDGFVQLHVDRFHPADEIESAILYQMAAATWRTRRMMAVETQMMNTAMDNHPTSPSALDRITSTFKDLAPTPEMKLNHRYQVSFSNFHARLLRTLLLLRQEFPAATPQPQPLPAPAPEPIPELPPEATKPPVRTKPAPPEPTSQPTEPTVDLPSRFRTCPPIAPKDLE